MKTEIQRTQADWHARHPHLRWKGSELVGPCMVCGTGDDRFYVRADGGAFCRVCCEDGSNPEAVKRLFAAHGFGGNGSADQFERDTGKAVTQLSTNGTGRPTEPPAPPLCGWQETNADGSVVTCLAHPEHGRRDDTGSLPAGSRQAYLVADGRRWPWSGRHGAAGLAAVRHRTGDRPLRRAAGRG